MMQAFAVSRRYLDTRSAQDSIDGLAAVALDLAPCQPTPEHRAQAATAWAYFDAYMHPTTGLAPVVADSHRVSPWEIGATLIAIISAKRLGLISPPQCLTHLALCLYSIAALPLGPTRLPALYYNVSDLSIVDAQDKSTDHASGWSARAILRLVAGLIIAAHHAPALAPEIALILRRWSLRDVVHNGRFRSGRFRNPKRPTLLADLFLGYEQYAARTACLINLPAEAGCDPRPIIDWQAYEGQVLPTDRRKDLTKGPPFTTEPLLLEALEFGWRQDMLDIALACFLAQKSRFAQTGHLTAFSEDALDRPPGFAYGAITAGDRAFASQSRSGRDLSRLHALSTKAAFSWDALVPCPYSQKLVDATSGLETKSGWYAGRYEHAAETNRVLSLNTNAVILEALHYKAYGPLFPTNENARA